MRDCPARRAPFLARRQSTAAAATDAAGPAYGLGGEAQSLCALCAAAGGAVSRHHRPTQTRPRLTGARFLAIPIAVAERPQHRQDHSRTARLACRRAIDPCRRARLRGAGEPLRLARSHAATNAAPDGGLAFFEIFWWRA